MRKLTPKMVQALVDLHVEGKGTSAELQCHGTSRGTLKRLEERGLVMSEKEGRSTVWMFTAWGEAITVAGIYFGEIDIRDWSEERVAMAVQVREYWNPGYSPTHLLMEETLLSPKRVQNVEEAHADALQEDHFRAFMALDNGSETFNVIPMRDISNNVGRLTDVVGDRYACYSREWMVVCSVLKGDPGVRGYILRNTHTNAYRVVTFDRLTNLY